MRAGIIVPVVFIASGLLLMSFQLYRFTTDTSLNHWHDGFTGYVQASQTQKETQKPILAFFYTDWCPNCRTLRENILAQNDVNQYLANLITVKINPEHGALENQISDEFGVLGYPTVLVILPSQKVISIRGLSNIKPEQFINRLKTVVNS